MSMVSEHTKPSKLASRPDFHEAARDVFYLKHETTGRATPRYRANGSPHIGKNRAGTHVETYRKSVTPANVEGGNALWARVPELGGSCRLAELVWALHHNKPVPEGGLVAVDVDPGMLIVPVNLLDARRITRDEMSALREEHARRNAKRRREAEEAKGREIRDVHAQKKSSNVTPIRPDITPYQPVQPHETVLATASYDGATRPPVIVGAAHAR